MTDGRLHSGLNVAGAGLGLVFAGLLSGWMARMIKPPRAINGGMVSTHIHPRACGVTARRRRETFTQSLPEETCGVGGGV